MTVSHPLEIDATAPRSHRLLEQLPEAILAVVVFALVTGAWLAFFMFVPLDFTPPRPG